MRACLSSANCLLRISLLTVSIRFRLFSDEEVDTAVMPDLLEPPAPRRVTIGFAKTEQPFDNTAPANAVLDEPRTQRDVSQPNGSYSDYTPEEIKEILVRRLQAPQELQSITLKCTGKRVSNFMSILYDDESPSCLVYKVDPFDENEQGRWFLALPAQDHVVLEEMKSSSVKKTVKGFMAFFQATIKVILGNLCVISCRFFLCSLYLPRLFFSVTGQLGRLLHPQRRCHPRHGEDPEEQD